MQYRKLEGIDQKLSVLIYGTPWTACRKDMRDEAYCSYDHAWEAGFRAFDTANSYGDGEETLGAWLHSRGIRGEAVIIDKGCNPGQNGSTDTMSAETIQNQVEKSLVRLQTDHVDFYLLHRDDPKVPVDEIIDVLNEKQREGKIRRFGVSNWSLRRVLAAEEYAVKHHLTPFTAFSPAYSLAEYLHDPWGGSISISVVVPLYNEEASLPELTEWIGRVVAAQGWKHEVILIDDGSTDGSWSVIESLREKDPAIHGIRFRRNYGKSAALFCGFKEARGRVVITMDADLQDSPDEMPELYRMVVEDNYDVVSGWKQHRKDNTLTKNLPSKLYNATARSITGIKLHDMNCGLKAYKNEVVKSIEVYGEMHRYIPYLAKNAGYGKIGEMRVHHQKRKYGKSKFGIERFVNGFLDLISLWFLSTFGRKPMHFFGFTGILMFLAGGIMTVWIIVAKLIHQAHGVRFRPVTDQPLFYLALVAVLLGVMLFLAGFICEMISRSNSDRNHYNIREQF